MIQDKLKKIFERRKLKQLKLKKRYQSGISKLLKRPICFPDAASFAFMYEEIFINEIYRFESEKVAPYIIDAGANIGLATIYFKQLFPDAKITCFEPDPAIYKVLKANIQNFDLQQIEVVQKGLSAKNGRAKFISEGADAGRITNQESNEKIEIDLTTLSGYLNQDVDFLKLDIEGSEVEVIEECKNYLSRVKNIFIEYHSFSDSLQQLSTLLKILEEQSFQYHIENPAFTKMMPFISKMERYGMNLQLNIFATR